MGISKSETNPKLDQGISKPRSLRLSYWDFEIVSDFDIRISDFAPTLSNAQCARVNRENRPDHEGGVQQPDEQARQLCGGLEPALRFFSPIVRLLPHDFR